MSDAVDQALALWGLTDASAALVAQRENTVWRVARGEGDLALRFHRPGYRTEAELRSELDWMAMLARGGLSVPAPVPRPDGSLIARVGDHFVSVLDWLDGHPIGTRGRFDARIADPVALARDLGRTIAQLHDLTDAWQPPAGFTRPDWRRDGLLGEAPLWGRFWDHPHLDSEGRALLLRARAAAGAALAEIEAEADQGLIHADILAENVMVQDSGLSLIDFDDCAIGFRDFDLATPLLKFADHPRAEALRHALIDGYASRRTVDHDQLELFILLRALTYPGWIMTRLDEPHAPERSLRMLATAYDLSNRFLKRRS